MPHYGKTTLVNCEFLLIGHYGYRPSNNLALIVFAKTILAASEGKLLIRD
jgi:hypothetical protein